MTHLPAFGVVPPRPRLAVTARCDSLIVAIFAPTADSSVSSSPAHVIRIACGESRNGGRAFSEVQLTGKTA